MMHSANASIHLIYHHSNYFTIDSIVLISVPSERNVYKLVMSVCFKNRGGNVIMATTIEEALYPLLLTSSLLGFGAYLPKKIYLNIFYNLIVWIIYPCLFYYLIIEFKEEGWFYEPLHITAILVSYLIVIISVITNICYNKVRIHTHTHTHTHPRARAHTRTHARTHVYTYSQY